MRLSPRPKQNTPRASVCSALNLEAKVPWKQDGQRGTTPRTAAEELSQLERGSHGRGRTARNPDVFCGCDKCSRSKSLSPSCRQTNRFYLQEDQDRQRVKTKTHLGK